MTNLRRRTSSPGGTWQSQRPGATTQAEVTGLPRLNGTRAYPSSSESNFPSYQLPSRPHQRCLSRVPQRARTKRRRQGATP